MGKRRDAAQEIGRSAAEDQKPRRAGLPVGQHTQHGEEIRTALHFVNHHQSLQFTQRRHRLIQPRYTHRVFQVEVIDGVLRQQLPRQGRLAALTRAGQRHDPAPFQGGTDGGEVIRSVDHADRIP